MHEGHSRQSYSFNGDMRMSRKIFTEFLSDPQMLSDKANFAGRALTHYIMF